MKVGYTFLLAFIVGFGSFFAYADDEQNTTNKCVLLLHTNGQIKNVCDHGGKPYLLLEFFSVHSKDSINNIQKFKELEQALALVAHSRLVSLSGLIESRKYAQRYAISTEIGLDLINLAKRGFGVNKIPATFVLDANNNIVFSHVGVLSDEVVNEIFGLLIK